MGNAPQAGGALREATVGENVLLSVPHTPVTTDEPRCLAGSRFRPWHYILAIRIDTVFRDEGEEGFRSEGYDDEQVARTNAADYDDGGYGTAGVWDNWAGGWLVEPDWADEVEMVAEGWSRVRPETDSLRAMKPLLWMRAVRDAEPRFRGKRLPVLWALALRMGPNGQGFASHHVLAADADVSEHTARRSTREARDRGYLDQTRRGGRRGTGVVMASEWALTEPSQPVTGDTLSATPTGHPLDVSDGPQTAKSGSPNGHPLAAQEVLSQEVSSKTPYVSTGSASVAANGGREPHKNEPNARRAIAALIRDRTLPFTVEQLLELAYTLGNGDPWDGYLLRVKAATEQSFTGARDPTAVLHKRLGLA